MLRHIFSLVEGVISSFEIPIPNFLGKPKRLLTVVRARAGPNFGARPSFVLRNYFKHILQKESIIVVGQAVKSTTKLPCSSGGKQSHSIFGFFRHPFQEYPFESRKQHRKD